MPFSLSSALPLPHTSRSSWTEALGLPWTLYPLTVVPGPSDPSHLQLPLILAYFYSFYKTWLSYQCSLWFPCSKCGLCTNSIPASPGTLLEMQNLRPYPWSTESEICIEQELQICVHSEVRDTLLWAVWSAPCTTQGTARPPCTPGSLLNEALLSAVYFFISLLGFELSESQDHILFTCDDSVTTLVPAHSRCSVNACSMSEQSVMASCCE